VDTENTTAGNEKKRLKFAKLELVLTAVSLTNLEDILYSNRVKNYKCGLSKAISAYYNPVSEFL
jgi:hypothetical protein